MLSHANRDPVVLATNTLASEIMALFRPPPWHADALCKEYSKVNFFPKRGQSTAPAAAVCSRCSVRGECLEAGMAGDESGVWGGAARRERRRDRSTPSGASIEAATIYARRLVSAAFNRESASPVQVIEQVLVVSLSSPDCGRRALAAQFGVGETSVARWLEATGLCTASDRYAHAAKAMKGLDPAA